MDALNLRVLVNLSGGTGDGAEAERWRSMAGSPAPDRMVQFAEHRTSTTSTIRCAAGARRSAWRPTSRPARAA